jgi:hypothetical protein
MIHVARIWYTKWKRRKETHSQQFHIRYEQVHVGLRICLNKDLYLTERSSKFPVLNYTYSKTYSEIEPHLLCFYVPHNIQRNCLDQYKIWPTHLNGDPNARFERNMLKICWEKEVNSVRNAPGFVAIPCMTSDPMATKMYCTKAEFDHIRSATLVHVPSTVLLSWLCHVLVRR